MGNDLPFISKTTYMGCLMVSDGTQERYIYNALLFWVALTQIVK